MVSRLTIILPRRGAAIRRIARIVAILTLVAGPAHAAQVRVMTSGAFATAYVELDPQFERAAGQTVVTAFGASMGTAPDSTPSRLQRGEAVDVVTLAAGQLDQLIAQGITRSGLEPVGTLATPQ